MFNKTKDNQFVTTEKGRDFLDAFVTDTRSQIYALKESLPSSISSAAMARLSRSADDLRLIILKEFLPLSAPPKHEAGREEGLLRRVITAYGDDSVQQLAGIYVVVQSASNLLTKLLERPRIGAAYLEQSTRYIFFDQKVQEDENTEPHYRYVVPKELDEKQAEHYRGVMDDMFRNYGDVVHRLNDWLIEQSTEPESSRDFAWKNAIRAQACDAARGMLPAATTSTVGIYASAQALDSLIMHLRGHTLAEARDAGNKILEEVRKVQPVFFERTDMPERGEATTAYIRETSDAVRDLCREIQAENSDYSLTAKFHPHEKEVELVTYWPHDELEIGMSLAYVHGFSEREFPPNRVTAKRLLLAYAGERLNRRHHPGRMFEQPHYTFRFRTSYGEFRDLQRHRMVDAFEWQTLKPDDDYEVPDLIAKAGLEKEYKQNFVLSSELYSHLNGYNDKVQQYAVLFGHKMNWQWTLNFREAMHIIELRTTPQGHPAYRKICQAMYQQIKSVHPHLASTIKFVNCGEDPELTRLAAERSAAFKLSLQQ